MESDNIRYVRYEPDLDDETADPAFNPLAFWHGFGVAALLSSVFWLSVLFAIFAR